LVSAGADVLCLDNFLSGSKKNIEHLIGLKNFEVIRHDVVEPILLEVDRIYHLACPASPMHYQANAVKTVKTNVMGAINMLGIAKRVKARILHASASEVYGDPQVNPQKENYWGNVDTIGLRSCYDEGKRVAETLMMDYHSQNGVDVRIARIFNTYGPRMPEADGRVVSGFVVSALANRPITIFGDGSQTRTFCYISDMIDGLVQLMETEDFTGPVNLGSSEAVSMRDLAALVLRLTGSASGITYAPASVEDVASRIPDIALAREKLGWEPGVGIMDGLSNVIRYFRDMTDKRT
jgi:UDP-glucuronate decarboxylase